MTQNSFTLTFAETIFKNMVLNEHIGKNDVFKLMKSDEYKKYLDSLPDDDGSITTQLKNIGKKIKNNTLSVKYNRKLPFGRVYGAKSHTYQAIKKEIKNSLSRNKYVDIDIVNAHYTILFNLCKIKGVKCPNIERYVKHRKEVMIEIGKTHGLKPQKTKNLFNQLLYDIDAEGYGDLPLGIVYLDNLKTEIKTIALQISNDNPKMKGKIKTAKKGKVYVELRSLLSYYLQEYENRILEVIYSCLLNKGFVKKGYATLFYDGIMVVKNDGITPHLLGEICNEIKKKVSMDIKLVLKPMTKILVDFNNCKVLIDDKKMRVFDGEYMNTLPNYKTKMDYFNHFVKKIRHPIPMYVWEDGIDREKHILNMTQLKETLLPIRSGEYTDKGDEIPFSKVWLEDDSVKVYRKMDFIPFNPDLEEEQMEDNENDDTYNLFVGYGDHIHAKYNKKHTEKLLRPFKELVWELVGAKQENYDYYISFLSQMIREPRDKVGISVVFKSEQGVGKNVHLIPIAQIIKDTHYKSSSNPADFFGDYAEGYYRKILVNMDEVELKSSFKNEGKMKTAITEPKLTINPKFLRPIEVMNFARTIMFSNKDYILPIDIKSGDRRFCVFGSTTYYLKYPTDFWINLIKWFNRPDVISCLYDYLMEWDYSDVNWIKGRPITEEYKKLIKQFIPPCALFMNKWILDTEPVIFEMDDDMDKEEKKETMEHNKEERDRITEPYEKDKSIIYRSFKDYIEENNLCGRDYKPSIKNFNNEIMGYSGVVEDNVNYTFNREEIKRYLISKKFMDCDLEEYKYLLEKEVINVDDDYFNLDSDDEEVIPTVVNDYDSDEEKRDE